MSTIPASIRYREPRAGRRAGMDPDKRKMREKRYYEKNREVILERARSAKKSRSELTREGVLKLLEYDPSTGEFRWRDPTRARKAKSGIAGSLDHEGYRQIGIYGRNYRASRLAWLIVNGAWPADMIDHINGARSDDRISNLRPATNAQNQCNKPARRGSSTGLKGVTRSKGKYRAQLYVAGRTLTFGHYDNPGDAHAAYRNAAKKYFGDFARFE